MKIEFIGASRSLSYELLVKKAMPTFKGGHLEEKLFRGEVISSLKQNFQNGSKIY
jgi:hypothetical protein